MTEAGTLIHYEHARDIDDREFLLAVRKAGIRKDGTGWACFWIVSKVLGGYGPDDDAPSPVPGVPDKVVIAKAKRLMGRGLLDGCGCGCRGDFELTPAGMALADAGR